MRTRQNSATSSRSSDAGYSDVAAPLFEGESDSATSPLDSSPGSEVSIATVATSVRSRSSSIGKTSLASVASAGPALWATRLETQVEEDELAALEIERTSSAVATGEDAPPADETSPPVTLRVPSPPAADNRTTMFSLGASLLSKRRKRGARGLEGEPVDPGAHAAEHWTPSFFDTVKGGSGSTRNPLSTRKATAIPRELVEELDFATLAEPQPLVSPPLPADPLIDNGGRFASPRPAPPPSLLVSSAQIGGTSSFVAADPPRSSTSSSSSRRHSFEPSSLALPRFAHPARPASPLTRSPSCSASGSPSIRSSISSGTSVRMDRFRSSSGGSASSADEAVTPVIPAGAFVPTETIIESGDCAGEIAGRGASSLGLTGMTAPLRDKSPNAGGSGAANDFGRLSPLPFVHGATAALSSASLATPSRVHHPAPPVRSVSAPVKSTSFLRASIVPPSPSKKPLSVKEQRHALEISVGTKVLEAAGASATEVRLRARSVGFQVLKQREEEAKKHGGGGGGKGTRHGMTGALGEYVGGEALGSRFSID